VRANRQDGAFGLGGAAAIRIIGYWCDLEPRYYILRGGYRFVWCIRGVKDYTACRGICGVSRCVLVRKSGGLWVRMGMDIWWFYC